MATMYALPTLSAWSGTGTSGGWSNTSGGVDNSSYPGPATDVVFDANSGSARSITLSNATALGLVMSAANSMTFSTGAIDVYGAVVNFGTSSFSSTASLWLHNTVALSGSGNLGTIYNYSTLTLQSNITCPQGFNHNAGSVNGNGFNLTTAYVTGSTGTMTLGSGTWTLTGNGIVWSLSSTTVVCGTSTIKITDTSSLLKTFNGGGQTFYNIWNATTGTGGLAINTCTLNNLKISPGAIQNITAGNTLTLTGSTPITADGGTGVITLSSGTSGSAATISLVGGIRSYVNWLSIKDITVTPAASAYATNSVNVSGNTNWTFLPTNSKFLAFF